MKKYLTIGLTAFAMGACASQFAVSSVPSSFKVAVIDVNKVVNASPQVAALKKEREAKMQDIAAFVDRARKDVIAQTDEKKKKDLEAKYNKELNDKKAAMDKHYADKLETIDKAITKQIENKAKKDGFDLVLTKGAVLNGGSDITDEIVKAVK